MPSPALLKFEDRMREVKRLLDLCVPDDADPNIKKEYFERDGSILRGAHVLLCSHLEGFFEDLIADLISAYDHLLTDLAQMPEELRAAQVMGASSKWDQKDPVKRWQTVTTWAAHPLIQLGPQLPPRCMDPDIHINGFANPGTNEIEELFKTVGVSKVWDYFAKHESDRFIKDAVNVIVNRRNQIAHGKLDASITLADATVYMSRARRVSTVFDIVITEHINARLSINTCWESLEEALQS
jgi:hypothetical protein